MKESSGKMETLAIAGIRIDGGTQPRAQIDQDVVSEYAEAMRAGVGFPSIRVFFDGAERWLADGFHRYHAARSAGLETLSAIVHSGTKRDAVLFSVGANAVHGLRRTNEDKRRAVMTLLADAEWGARSDSWIAEKCGVGDGMVAARRADLQVPESGTSPHRVGKDGKSYPVQRKPRAKPTLSEEQRNEIRAQIAEEHGEVPEPEPELEAADDPTELAEVPNAFEEPAPDLSTLDAREEAVGIAAHPLSRLMAEWPKGASMSPLIQVIRYMLHTCERIEDGLQPKDGHAERGGESAT